MMGSTRGIFTSLRGVITLCAEATVRYKTMTLQIPPSPHRHHYVKIDVRVHHYPDDRLAIFHGPREIGRYLPGGALKTEAQNDPREARPLRPGSGPAPATPSLALRNLASRYERNRTYDASSNRTSSFALDIQLARLNLVAMRGNIWRARISQEWDHASNTNRHIN